MNDHGEMPPLRPVRADEVIPDTRWWQSPKRAAIRVGSLVVVWAIVFLATTVWHVQPLVVISIGAALTVIAVAVDVARWLRRRRR